MTQQDKVIKYVQKNGSINAVQAVFELGITRISAVVYALKSTAHALKTVPSKSHQGFMDYVPDYAARQRNVITSTVTEAAVLKDPFDKARVMMRGAGKLMTISAEVKKAS